VSDFEHPPYADEPVVPGPSEQLADGASAPGRPAPGAMTDLLPQAGPAASRRRPGRSVVAATLAVLLVLVAGGAAYGWTVLQRPEVKLSRAFDAAKSAAQGTMSVSVKASGTAAAGATVMTSSSLRYSWSPGTQQFSVVYDGKKVGTVTTTDTDLTVQIEPTAFPQGTDPADALGSLGGLGGLGALGGAGDVVTALLDGKPVRVAIGPGSALQKALDKAANAGGSSGSAELSPAQVGKVVDSVTAAVKDSATVTEAGSDADGTHYVATVALTKVVDTAWKDIAALVPGGAAGMKPDLSQLEKTTLTVDVWVKDGAVTRVEVPLGPAMADVAPAGGDVRIVVVLSGEGVRPVEGPVTDVPDSLFDLLGGLG
jgi:hypothetical protein